MFTQPQFEAFISNYTGVVYAIPATQVGRFNYLKDKYLEQVEELNIFNLDDVVSTKNYDIPHCSLEYLPVPLWSRIDTVVKISIKDSQQTNLVVDTDYSVDTDTIKINKIDYIQALNFKCLSCNCACEKIRVTGKYGLVFSTNLLNALFLILYKNIQKDELTSVDCCDDIESIQAGSVTLKYSNSDLTTDEDVDDIFSYPEFTNLGKYKKHFIRLY
ncbi:MAG: hypothetical protein ACRCZ2_10035 [Fusobacteriaceae bacterium]